METNSTTPKPVRGRGAPKGNLNAFKHGFYSKRFRVGEIDDLLQIPLGSLKGEIAMLRVITRRAAEMLDAGEPIENLLPTYDFIGKMCMRLSSLMRTEKIIEGRADLTEELTQTIETVRVAIQGHESEQESL